MAKKKSKRAKQKDGALETKKAGKDKPKRSKRPKKKASKPSKDKKNVAKTTKAPVDDKGEKVMARKKALCIGIDQYSRSPLNGCVSDARAWSEWFDQQGFATDIIINRKATRDGILNAVGSIIRNSSPGDVIAIQYSGHGTSIAQTSGDEAADEALVPIDCDHAGCIIDDQIAAICDGIPESVSVTFFLDCCHSGTATRFMLGHQPALGKARYMPVTPEMQEAHTRACRADSRSRGSSSPDSPYANRPEILFSGCEAAQKSYESDGHGHFTIRALEVLKHFSGTMTNGQFIDKVRGKMPNLTYQNPKLWSDSSKWDMPLLSPIRGFEQASDGGHGQAYAPTQNHDDGPLSESLDDAIRALTKALKYARERGL